MKDKGQNTLPADVYLSFVSSLYGNRQTLFVGMISHVVTFSFVYAKTSDPFFLIWSALVVLIWALRAQGMRYFDRADKTALDMGGIRYWENWYNLGAVGTTLALGTACGMACVLCLTWGQAGTAHAATVRELERELTITVRREALRAERAALEDARQRGLIGADAFETLTDDVNKRIDALRQISQIEARGTEPDDEPTD